MTKIKVEITTSPDGDKWIVEPLDEYLRKGCPASTQEEADRRHAHPPPELEMYYRVCDNLDAAYIIGPTEQEIDECLAELSHVFSHEGINTMMVENENDMEVVEELLTPPSYSASSAFVADFRHHR